MPPGRSSRGSSSRGRGSGRGSGRGRGGRGRGGRGGRSSGRGTVLPSSLTGRAGGGERTGIRRSRGGGGGDSGGSAGYEFEDTSGGATDDRSKYDDEAGDSDNGPDPDDSDFEDEEVDEDAAFDSADEARYGEIMDAILERRNGKQESSNEDEDDDEGDAGEGGMSLMDMLNANEAAETSQEKKPSGTSGSIKKGKGKQKGRGINNDREESSSSRTAPASEVSSDDGLNEEDNGGGLTGGVDDMDQEEVVSQAESGDSDDNDESDNEGDEEERHARLMGFVGSLGDQAEAASRAAEDRSSVQLLKEGEFNATVTAAGAGGGDGPSRKGGVTMEALMGSLQNSKGFATVKKQVTAFSGAKPGALSGPVHKTAELRAEREAAYDSRKTDMAKWVAPVQANRRAETLDFTPTVKTNLSNASLASKLEATTDMEKEVEMLLTAGGASEASLAEKEMEELKSKAYTVEEVRERQAELAKMRALMFYQERKQHHMNKIKSKVYRKIRKRQRERAGGGELGDDDRENGNLSEKAARKRAEERMSLRHKNTTKWVKNALRAKGGAGKDDRKAISEQLRLGQELRAKMDAADDSDDSSGDDTSSNEESIGGQERLSKKKKKSALSEANREELEGIATNDNAEGPVSGKGAALLKMAFMQKAMEKQKKRAKEEATVLLRELEEAAADAEENSEDDARNVNEKPKKKKRHPWGEEENDEHEGSGPNGALSKEARAAAAADVAKALPLGALQSSAVSMDSRVRSSVASPITIDLEQGAAAAGNSFDNSASSLMGVGGGKVQMLNRPGDDAEAESMAVESERSKRRREEGALSETSGAGMTLDGGEEEMDGDADAENPWLAPTPRRSKERRRKSNGEVLLDVKKAAATALSTFDGGAFNDDEEVHTNSNSRGGRGGTDGTSDPKAARKGFSGVGKEKGGEGGRGKRRRGSSGGGGNFNEEENGTTSANEKGFTEKALMTANGESSTKGNNKKKARHANGGAAHDSNSEKAAAAAGKPSPLSPGSKQRGSDNEGVRLTGLSNDELVRRAFAAPDFDTEFKESKDDEVQAAVSKGREKLPGDVAGWGSWAGEGAPIPRGPSKRQVLTKKTQKKKEEILAKARKDDRLPKVVINEKRQKRSAKYLVAEVPYPFTSREQYERSLRQPIGAEWNTSQSVREMSRPAVVVRAGTVVAPMKLGKLHRDNAKDKEAGVVASKGAGGRGGKGIKKAGASKGGGRR